eukprot:1159330-Pelagomonas_calceolata.AAC.11
MDRAVGSPSLSVPWALRICYFGAELVWCGGLSGCIQDCAPGLWAQNAHETLFSACAPSCASCNFCALAPVGHFIAPVLHRSMACRSRWQGTIALLHCLQVMLAVDCIEVLRCFIIASLLAGHVGSGALQQRPQKGLPVPTGEHRNFG